VKVYKTDSGFGWNCGPLGKRYATGKFNDFCHSLRGREGYCSKCCLFHASPYVSCRLGFQIKNGTFLFLKGEREEKVLKPDNLINNR